MINHSKALEPSAPPSTVVAVKAQGEHQLNNKLVGGTFYGSSFATRFVGHLLALKIASQLGGSSSNAL